MRTTLPLLLGAVILINACTTSAKETRYAADDALLEQSHTAMQQRLDTATAHFNAFAEKVKKAKPDDPAPRELERTSIWLGDLESIVASDERFMAERAAALSNDATASEEAFTIRYDELMQGHDSMVAEFNAIADRLEQRIAGY
ncbi:MAG: hypothetical protein JNM62_11770 [Flavobacteriales bacterium]|nr:hypothetical protein [Flavobacteriales bacterium]